MQRIISQDQWSDYHRDGFLKIGRQCGREELADLQQRIDEIMLGRAPLDYGRLTMQLDSNTDRYDQVKGGGIGHQGASLGYRKIQGLEFDALFLAYMKKPVFREICGYIYGAHASVACFRAMFMNKPAQQGSDLPWHQDGGSSWYVDRDPLVTVWTALDPATTENGCVQVVPGSHQLGILSEKGHTITDEQEREFCRDDGIVDLTMEPGEVVILHNWLLHRSGLNRIDIPRRAFSVCYIDARTRSSRKSSFSMIFGDGALMPEQVAA
ncbi:MAG: phytanoyl-CoA dioxygenase family protein [Gemmatimonadota bacterium]|nr:phytanoyl-CoA dioxygenase family protein [Gemmatimonadota bacterium]